MFKNKGFSAIALVVILAVLAVGGYAVWQKQAINPPSNSNPSTPASPAGGPSVDTTNWKTYRNDKYGFEFKYPGNWVLELQPESLSLKSFGVTVADHLEGQHIPPANRFTVLVDSTSKCHQQDWGPLGTDGYAAKTGFKQTCFTNAISVNMSAVIESAKIVDDQILSTFRFVKSEVSSQTSDTSNWKTYRNDKYGFEFKYPAERIAFVSVDASNEKLIPAPSNSDEVHIAQDAQSERLALCCEANLLSFSVIATTTAPREWIKKRIDIPEWQGGQIIVKDITFAGKPATEANGQYSGYAGPGHMIAVRLTGSSMLVIKDVDSSPFPEILSTFRFIK